MWKGWREYIILAAFSLAFLPPSTPDVWIFFYKAIKFTAQSKLAHRCGNKNLKVRSWKKKKTKDSLWQFS